MVPSRPSPDELRQTLVSPHLGEAPSLGSAAGVLSGPAGQTSGRAILWRIPACPCLPPIPLPCVSAKSLSCVQLCSSPRTVAHQASLSIGFSRQEYCSGLPCPSPRDLPNLGTEPVSPALAGMFFTTSATWEAHRGP